MNRQAMIMAMLSMANAGAPVVWPGDEADGADGHKLTDLRNPLYLGRHCPECGRPTRERYCSGSPEARHAKRRVYKESGR